MKNGPYSVSKKCKGPGVRMNFSNSGNWRMLGLRGDNRPGSQSHFLSPRKYNNTSWGLGSRENFDLIYMSLSLPFVQITERPLRALGPVDGVVII